MSIRDTTTYEELIRMTEVPAMAVSWAFEAKILVDGESVGVSNVLHVNNIGNYGERYYGDHLLTVQVDPLAYKAMNNNPNKIKVELVRAQMSVDGLEYTEVKRFTLKYNAFLTDAKNSSILSKNGWNTVNGDNVEQLSNLIPVTLHLIEPIVAEMRFAETGGVFKNVTLEEVLKIVLGYGLGPEPIKPLLEDLTYTGIRGVDVIPPDNQRRYKHIVIPVGSRLVNIPKYLQETYGIYNTGLGWHIEKQRCFVYPLLRNVDYDKRHKVLTILNVPTKEIPVMERTFMLRDSQVYVFSTGETKHYDRVEHVQNNIGNGIRFSRASDLVDFMEDTTVNKSIWDVNKTVKAMLVDKRPDEKQNVRFVDNRITDNPYKYLSKLSSGLGTTVEINWDYADPLLLYPGMQVKLLYMDEGEVKSLDGVLIGVSSVAAPPNDSMLNRQFIYHCTLTIHLKRLTEIIK